MNLSEICPNTNLSWLLTNTLFLTKHGSHAYGTNTPTSDLDIRGICIASKDHYIGTKVFEQATFSQPHDVVIFDIKKFVKLALDFNPNAVEILFTDPADHYFVRDEIKGLIEHKEKFISKRARYTLSGYATAQLKRIKLHRKYILNPINSKPTRSDFGLPDGRTLIPQHQLLEIEDAVKKKLSEWQFDSTGLDDAASIEIRSKISDMFVDMKINTDELEIYAARSLGLDDNLLDAFKSERQYRTAKREYDNYVNWKNTRNKERYAIEEKWGFDLKHSMHLVRLMRECREVLTTGKVLVKRHDAQELLAIKNGAWTYEQLIEWADQQDKEMDELYKTSTLPKEPDRNFIEGLMMDIIESFLFTSKTRSVVPDAF